MYQNRVNMHHNETWDQIKNLSPFVSAIAIITKIYTHIHINSVAYRKHLLFTHQWLASQFRSSQLDSTGLKLGPWIYDLFWSASCDWFFWGQWASRDVLFFVVMAEAQEQAQSLKDFRPSLTGLLMIHWLRMEH